MPRLWLGYCYSPPFPVTSETTCFPGEGTDPPAFLVYLMSSRCSSPSSLSFCNVFLGLLGSNILRDPLMTCTASPSSWDAVRRKGFLLWSPPLCCVAYSNVQRLCGVVTSCSSTVVHWAMVGTMGTERLVRLTCVSKLPRRRVLPAVLKVCAEELQTERSARFRGSKWRLLLRSQGTGQI